jgi:hypothetical protein
MTEYQEKALSALQAAEVKFGDAASETNKALAEAITYALLDVARAIRSGT